MYKHLCQARDRSNKFYDTFCILNPQNNNHLYSLCNHLQKLKNNSHKETYILHINYQFHHILHHKYTVYLLVFYFFLYHKKYINLLASLYKLDMVIRMVNICLPNCCNIRANIRKPYKLKKYVF